MLTVDTSDPSAVTFTATGAAPLLNDDVASGVGFSLLDFWTFEVGFVGEDAIGVSLLAGTDAVEIEFADTPPADATFLNLYEGSNERLFSFDTGAAAFSGSDSFDFSGFASALPGAGTSGSIRTGENFFAPFGEPLGAWQVVSALIPLPAGFPLILTALGALALLRRFRTR